MTLIDSNQKRFQIVRGAFKGKKASRFFRNPMHIVTLAVIFLLVVTIVVCFIFAKPPLTLTQSFEKSFPILNTAGLCGVALILCVPLVLSLLVTARLAHQGASYIILTLLLVPTFWLLSSLSYFHMVDVASVGTWAQETYNVEIADTNSRKNPDSIVNLQTGEKLYAEKQYNEEIEALEWILKSYTTGTELKRTTS